MIENYKLITKEEIDKEEVKNRIVTILAELGCEEKRPFQMDVTEFLQLLTEMRKKQLFLG